MLRAFGADPIHLHTASLQMLVQLSPLIQLNRNLPSWKQSPTCIVLYSTSLAPFCKRCKLEINMTHARFFSQVRTSFPTLDTRWTRPQRDTQTWKHRSSVSLIQLYSCDCLESCIRQTTSCINNWQTITTLSKEALDHPLEKQMIIAGD